MTNPNDKPSFLARLAVVATIGIITLQIGMGIVVGFDAKRGLDVDTEDWICVVLFPSVSFSIIQCLYYLIKGKPTNSDAFIAKNLTSVWVLSIFFGVIYCLLV